MKSTLASHPAFSIPQPVWDVNMSACKVGQEGKQNWEIKWLLKRRKRCCLVVIKCQKAKCKFALEERNGKEKDTGSNSGG